jgi:dTDP-glucose 4,6-dehydratase
MGKRRSMKTYLITGGAGFIGSNFVHYLLGNSNNCRVVNLDILSYAGNLENLKGLKHDDRYIFVKGDIRDHSLIARLFKEYMVDVVVNFAAESHVDRSITEPSIFLDVNIKGTQTLLEAALHTWRIEADNKYCREYKPGVKFLQVSTDEVYGTLSLDAPPFSEVNPLMPNSPYSASKASADLFVRAYNETYGLPVNITRCSNNYGPYQFPEKLIPLMINNALHNTKLPVYGDGQQIRDWLYVEDHCSALYTVLEKGESGCVYNIGGNNEKTNLAIVKLILAALEKPESLIEHIKDRPGHDRRYAINNEKITSSLGWEPAHVFEEGIQRTIQWYLEQPDWVSNVTSGAYLDYYDATYG